MAEGGEGQAGVANDCEERGGEQGGDDVGADGRRAGVGGGEGTAGAEIAFDGEEGAQDREGQDQDQQRVAETSAGHWAVLSRCEKRWW